MARTPVETRWSQTALLLPEAVEAVLRVGVVGASDHAQWLVEASDATSKTTLAMVSMPHFRVGEIESQLAVAYQELLEALRGYVLPF